MRWNGRVNWQVATQSDKRWMTGVAAIWQRHIYYDGSDMSNRLRRVLQLVISNFNLAGIAVNFNHLSADRGRY